MPLVDACKNRMLEVLKFKCSKVNVISESFVSAVQTEGAGAILGQNLAINDNTTKPHNSLDLTMVWDNTGVGECTSINYPSVPEYDPLIWAIEETKYARTVIFILNNVVTGVMQLETEVAGGSYGAPLYLNYIKLKIT